MERNYDRVIFRRLASRRIVKIEGKARKAFSFLSKKKEDEINMGNDTFLNLCKNIVVDYFNRHKDKTDVVEDITTDDVFIVWSCKTLQNNKALLSTTKPDGMYYEITHNGDRQETYVDADRKSVV